MRLSSSTKLIEAEPGRTFRDMALLVRNTEVLPEFTAAFDEAGIPYVVNRGKGFYETREVGDLVQLLRASFSHDRWIPEAFAGRAAAFQYAGRP